MQAATVYHWAPYSDHDRFLNSVRHGRGDMPLFPVNSMWHPWYVDVAQNSTCIQKYPESRVHVICMTIHLLKMWLQRSRIWKTYTSKTSQEPFFRLGSLLDLQFFTLSSLMFLPPVPELHSSHLESLANFSFTVTVLPAGFARSQASSKPFS